MSNYVSKCEKSLLKFFQKFNLVFENDNIDKIVYDEFGSRYSLLPLLVKSRLYYNQQ